MFVPSKSSHVSGTERSQGRMRFFSIFQSHFRQQLPWACICPLCPKSPSFRTVRKVCWSSWYLNSPHRLENRWHTWTGLSLTLEPVELRPAYTLPQQYYVYTVVIIGRYHLLVNHPKHTLIIAILFRCIAQESMYARRGM